MQTPPVPARPLMAAAEDFPARPLMAALCGVLMCAAFWQLSLTAKGDEVQSTRVLTRLGWGFVLAWSSAGGRESPFT